MTELSRVDRRIRAQCLCLPRGGRVTYLQTCTRTPYVVGDIHVHSHTHLNSYTCSMQTSYVHAGMRAAGKDAPLRGPARASAFSPFLACHALVRAPWSVVGRSPSRGGSVLGGYPRLGPGATNWVRWGPGIAAFRPDSLPPGGCQHLSPPAPCMEPGRGHPETRGPSQAGLSGQGDFRLKINGEAEPLIIRLGGRWQERGVNI